MQALFWLAHNHPAVTLTLGSHSCSQCGCDHCLLARFCRHCRSDLTLPAPLPQQARLRELWSESGHEAIDCLLASHSLLATARPSGWLDLWALAQHGPPRRLPLRRRVEAAALLDNLFVGLAQDQVEVVHLTPELCHDVCRYDRNSHFSSPGPLASEIAQDARRLVWLAGDQLLCYRARPQGLTPQWRTTVTGPSLGVALSGDTVYFLGPQSLHQFGADHGNLLRTTPLPHPALAMRAQGEWVWIAGRRGELWRWSQGELSRAWAGECGPCYSFTASAQHVVLCGGRCVHILDLGSGRQHTVELPQPCVLAPLLGPHWALLASYEGMVYQLALDQQQPRVVQAKRPFTSFEPTTVQPLLAGEKVIMAGPEGQLAVWSLASWP